MSWCPKGKGGSNVKTDICAPKTLAVTAIFSRAPLAPVSCFVRGTKGVTYPIINAASFLAKVPRYHHS